MVPVSALLSCARLGSVGMAPERSGHHHLVGSVTTRPGIGLRHEVGSTGSERTLQAPARRAIIVIVHTSSSSRSTWEFVDVPFTKSAVWTVTRPDYLSFFSMSLKKSIVSEGELDLTHNLSMIAR